jgi:hypothetical protein
VQRYAVQLLQLGDVSAEQFAKLLGTRKHGDQTQNSLFLLLPRQTVLLRYFGEQRVVDGYILHKQRGQRPDHPHGRNPGILICALDAFG